MKGLVMARQSIKSMERMGPERGGPLSGQGSVEQEELVPLKKQLEGDPSNQKGGWVVSCPESVDEEGRPAVVASFITQYLQVSYVSHRIRVDRG